MTPGEVDEAMAELHDIKTDPTKSATRYEEIIDLRMFLLDIKDRLKKYNTTEERTRITEAILARAQKWGEEGDCV